uniref:Leucine-rich repeat-containing protein 59 n=1 Tax=Elaeophora elaphi TaxID=1147741 RepID=A0A0R3RSV4_9BILA
MNGEIPLKDLRALLDDNNIDLSMCQLVSIPVKSLSKIPRAAHLDFSNNLIRSIPADFCLLTHVTKLDLSNNHIVHLPAEFGKLINLVHLDLYKNEIEELPLSFGDLVSLKWLDLKGNPLELELSQAAGDCMDEKGCKSAALNVVRLMRDRSSKQHRILEKQKSVKKQCKDSDAAVHGSTIQKEKTKKRKNKHRDPAYERLEPAVEHTQQNGPRAVSRKNEKAGHETKRNEKRKSNMMSVWWRILTVLFVLTLVMSILAVVVVVASCVDEPWRWVLSSKPFCEDLQTIVKKHSFPPTIASNFFLSIASLLKPYTHAAGASWEELNQKYDLVDSIKDSYYLLYMKLVSVRLLVQGYAVHKYEDFMAFYNKYAADAVDNTVKNIWLLMRIFGLMVADLLMLIVGEGFFFISSVVETIFTYAYRGDQLAEVLQNWWNKMKDYFILCLLSDTHLIHTQTA